MGAGPSKSDVKLGDAGTWLTIRHHDMKATGPLDGPLLARLSVSLLTYCLESAKHTGRAIAAASHAMQDRLLRIGRDGADDSALHPFAADWRQLERFMMDLCAAMRSSKGRYISLAHIAELAKPPRAETGAQVTRAAYTSFALLAMRILVGAADHACDGARRDWVMTEAQSARTVEIASGLLAAEIDRFDAYTRESFGGARLPEFLAGLLAAMQ
jgi:hypothetical protein